MYDIVSVGETLIDFTPLKKEGGCLAFEQNPGGAPANLAVAAASMGAKSAFVGKVGADQFGLFLEKTLQEHGVETRGLVKGTNCKTTLAFVHLHENGQREFDFYRGADLLLSEEEVTWDLIENARIVHVSSLAFCGEITAKTTWKIIEKAKTAGAWLSYDANWRPMLWPDQEKGKKLLAEGNRFADIVKASEEELAFITGIEHESQAAEALIKKGVKLVLVTKGEKGSAAYTSNAHKTVTAFTGITPVDTTGAGDIFFGTFLTNMLQKGKESQEFNDKELALMLREANAAAGLSVVKRGGISSVPTLEEVKKFLADNID